MAEQKQTKKLTLVPLILMIFTSVFGFTNMPKAFYLMGYSSIPWYILSAFLFFIPYAFMMSEYGSAFKKEKGGIYSWMEKSVGGKFAFVCTFMWYASYIIWMVNVASGMWITLSNGIFGRDTTPSWTPFGLSSVQTLGILGMIWIVIVTVIASHGLNNISKITSIGGTAVALLNIVLIVGGCIVLIANGGLAEPITNFTQSFTKSPMPEYQSLTGIFSFLTFAIFAYGGLEVIGGLVDQTENAERTFPKGVLISAVIISAGYAIGIFVCGMFTNWQKVLGSDKVHLGNASYVLLHNLGYQLGVSFGVSEATAITMGNMVARFVGISMFLAVTGAFFTLCYSPLKTIIEGAPREIWPGKLGVLEDGMPKHAMKVQAVIVILILAFVSFGGNSAAQFFKILTFMTNVAMTVPYMFLSIGFIYFKKKQLAGEIECPYTIYKTQRSANIAAIVVTFVIGFANLFTILEPTITSPSGLSQTITMAAGPIIFTVVAYILYSLYERRTKNNPLHPNRI